MVQQQAALAGKSTEERKKQAALEKQKEDLAKAKARDLEIASLAKPVRMQKVPFGVDPKTLLCEFFKAGHCDKGAKCKFSHDPNVGRKVEKRNVYEDGREDKLDGMSCGEFLLEMFFNYFWKTRWTNGTRRN